LQGVPKINIADPSRAIDRAAAGDAPEPAPTPTGVVAATWETSGGAPMHVIMDSDRDQERPCTAVASLDTSTHIQQDQWADWLHLGNLFGGLEADAIITTTKARVPAGGVVVTPSPAVATPNGDIADRLQDCFDETAEVLATSAADAGYGDFEVGYEPGWTDGTVLEVSWPGRRVGILPSSADPPEETHDWTVLSSTDWTIEALLAALHATNL
jgi:hypothetical protein